MPELHGEKLIECTNCEEWYQVDTQILEQYNYATILNDLNWLPPLTRRKMLNLAQGLLQHLKWLFMYSIILIHTSSQTFTMPST